MQASISTPESKGDRVTLYRLADAMSVSSERTRHGLRWRTDFTFTRRTKHVQSAVEVHILGTIPEQSIELKEPLIVKRLKRVYGLEQPIKPDKKTIRPDTKRKASTKRTRAAEGELTQDDVAKDFGVSRATINKWERTQTADDQSNDNNPYGYYKSLRTNPSLRAAYTLLAAASKAYNETKAKAQKQGK